jgi:hypothetical protein
MMSLENSNVGDDDLMQELYRKAYEEPEYPELDLLPDETGEDEFASHHCQCDECDCDEELEDSLWDVCVDCAMGNHRAGPAD